MRNHEMFPAGGAADAARRSEGDVSGAVAARARTPRSTRCTTRAAICERRFVVLLEELLKKKRSFLGRIRLEEASPVAGVGGGFSVKNPLVQSERSDVNCRCLADITRRRARHTVPRPRRGASRTLQAVLRRRGDPSGPVPDEPFAPGGKARVGRRTSLVAPSRDRVKDADDGTERRR